MLAAVGWPDVLVALIAGLPGIIAAVAALLVRQEVKTANGRTLAKSVEKTEAVVTRTLGERKTDGKKPPGIPDAHKRAGDD